jgi:AAT family amino acid transporter
LLQHEPISPGTLKSRFGLLILAAIFTVGFIGEDSRPQLLSTFALVALLAVANWMHHRNGKVAPVVETSDSAKQSVLID